jgi:flagellar protein FliS
MKNAYSTYKTANIDTADQGKLIIIAYDVAIKNCKLALNLFHNDHTEIEERSKYLYKIQDAVGELMGSLNLEVGEISQNLYKLYDYMIRRVIEAMVKKDPKPVTEVLGYLTDLRDAWKVAIDQTKEENAVNPNALRTKTIAVSG